MSFNKPDLTAPRFRILTHNPISDSFYKELKERNSNLKKYSNSEILTIIKKSNEKIWNTVITERDGVELESLGYVFIGSCNKPRSSTDYGISTKYNQRIPFRNLETDGNIAKIFYINSVVKYKFKFQNLWKFEPCKNFTTTVSEKFRKNWQKYITIPPNFKIYKLFGSKKKLSKDEADEKIDMYGFK